MDPGVGRKRNKRDFGGIIPLTCELDDAGGSPRGRCSPGTSSLGVLRRLLPLIFPVTLGNDYSYAPFYI